MSFDAAIIGAGASGLMCAIRAAARGLSVCAVDHRQRFGRKIAISGGGRANFTNQDMRAGAFLCGNPHFVKSALARFTPADIVAMVGRHGLPVVEKEEGQLFLGVSAERLLDALAAEARRLDVRFAFGGISSVRKEGRFFVRGGFGEVEADKLVVASGGLSYPKLGASDIGHRIARQFGHRIVPTRPGLVPLVFAPAERRLFSPLSGISFRARASLGRVSFEDECLITHRGLSGPAILRLSSFWDAGEKIELDFLPDADLPSILEAARKGGSRKELKTVLSRYLPDRLARVLCDVAGGSRPLCTYGPLQTRAVANALKAFCLTPAGTEGYGRAEVTVGGVDTNELSSKTMESSLCPGLYFAGEVLDVTGDLGGFNLHWAWASGAAAGDAL